ncbi:MAG: 2OG-Fe dioxygenase family protein [Rubrivivax sp.]|jgi:hypothetical protein|nr:2OG-Fe dioxygenase family protein [Rubrivivax sp.]
MNPSPPWTHPDDVDRQLADVGWAVLDPTTLGEKCWTAAAGPWREWATRFWSDLPPDPHLRDGGRYRHRRHGCFWVSAGQVQPVAHRAHWQPLEYNALHGGFERWFDPLPSALMVDPAWSALLAALARTADGLRGPQPWFVEAHLFRIDTAGGIGRPTPEGAHRDGVDLVAVVLVDRQRVKGGETRVFDALGPHGVRFTLTEPGSALLLDDARVIHETTPIQPETAGGGGWRDTLVLTYRSGGFQGPAVPSAKPPEA